MARCKDCVVGLLGPCSDYCAFERELMEEQARELAEANGHALGAFAKKKGEAIWEARCERCAWLVSFSLTPGPGQPDIYGPGLVLSCATHAD